MRKQLHTFWSLACPGLIAATLTLPLAAVAQVPWETPRLMGPDSPQGFGLLWTRFGTLPGDGDGLMAVWRTAGLPAGVSLRVGGAEGAGGRTAVFAGVDVRSPLARHGTDQPLDLAWTAGAGLGAGDYALLTVPVGISAGRSWSSGAIWLAPYVGVGLAMDLALGSDAPADEFEVSPAIDLGMDLALDRRRTVVLRVAAALGDRHAIAVGVSAGAGAR
jgi:hypothetical protein